jgi:L-lysine 2,3-aminomutase
LVKKNAELFLLEQSIDDLNRSYELLKQNVKYEEEAFSKANNELIKIKQEINERIPYYNKLIAVRNEFESVSLQLIACKKEIEKIENQNNIISEVPEKREPQNNSVTQTPEQKQKCKAKTKSGSKCKRFAVEGSLYCKSHSSMNK